MSVRPCPECKGARLRPESRAVRVGGRGDPRVHRDERQARARVAGGARAVRARTARSPRLVLREIEERLRFLDNVGVGYLTLDRAAATLSGGEAQRIRLATQIGSSLVGVLYILDEPSIGLHQRDNARLIATLERLRDLGNTVLVVEHDEGTMRAADHLIDMGPGAGEHGGHVVAEGTAERGHARRPESLTGQFLAGTRRIEVPRAPAAAERLRRRSRARAQHNLKDVDVRFPLGTFTASPACRARASRRWSTRSSTRRVAQPAAPLAAAAGRAPAHRRAGAPRQGHRRRPVADRAHAALEPGHLHRAVRPDPRPVRQDARRRGRAATSRGASRSTSRAGAARSAAATGRSRSRCTSCPTSTCRARSATASATTARRSTSASRARRIADVLDMTGRGGARASSTNIPKIRRQLQTLHDVGLGYMRLGQPATTLSGGEAQRVKLASRAVARVATGRTLYILDEPTTGLHFADIAAPARRCSQRLVDAGQHGRRDRAQPRRDQDRRPDHRPGPRGRRRGRLRRGRRARPRRSRRSRSSYTGQFLRGLVEPAAGPKRRAKRRKVAAAA